MRAVIVVIAMLAAGVARAGETPLHFLLGQQSRFKPSKVLITGSNHTQERIGRASWYGGAGERLNRYTASGEPFRPMANIAAHRSLAFGTRLEVTNLANGRRCIVRVVDRGPALWTGRDLDLSRGAAAQLGYLGAGEARVSYRVVD